MSDLFQHPATARLRAQIEKVEAFPATAERDAYLLYCAEQLGRFECGAIYPWHADLVRASRIMSLYRGGRVLAAQQAILRTMKGGLR